MECFASQVSRLCWLYFLWHQVIIAQWLALRFAISEVPGSNRPLNVVKRCLLIRGTTKNTFYGCPCVAGRKNIPLADKPALFMKLKLYISNWQQVHEGIYKFVIP